MSNIQIKNEADLKSILANQYMKQINNFFGDDKRAMKFLSGVMASVQKLPDLLNCEPKSLINSFMSMAQLGFMPSDVSGEAYVLPYNVRGVKTAQFQMGYQGFLTLFYRAGVKSIRSEIVRKNDVFDFTNGKVTHTIDIFKSNEERGEAIGAYAVASVNGEEISKVMNAKDILAFGARFSKSFKTDFTPWKENNDPELWMWKKTVIKQLAKMLPKNEIIDKAISEDNKDSVISDRLEKAKEESEGLKMGELVVEEEKSVTAEELAEIEKQLNS